MKYEPVEYDRQLLMDVCRSEKIKKRPFPVFSEQSDTFKYFVDWPAVQNPNILMWKYI